MKRGITKLVCIVQTLTSLVFAALLLAAAPPAAAQTYTSTLTHLDSDAFGNIILATDEQGNVLWRERYQPYGATRINQASKTNPVNLANPQDRGANSIGFHGKEADAATGLSYFGARYYDPVAGRFMGTDAVRFDPANPHSFNRYAYGNGNPYKYKDPDGNLPVLAPLLLAARALWVARGAQVAITGAEIAAGDALGGASLAVGAAAGAKVVGKTIDAAVVNEGKTLFHYTDAAGAKGIAESGVIRADTKGRVFATDQKLAPADVKDRLFTGRSGDKGSHVVEIQPRDGLAIRPGKNQNELIHQGSIRDGRQGNLTVKPNDFQ